MLKITQLLRSFLSEKILYAYLILLVSLSVMVVSSYILSSWMMRPVGDDYGSLLAYHFNANWLQILPETVIGGGGRYGQTIVSIFWYGEFGLRGLKLTGILSVGLFLLASYLAIIAWQKTRQTVLNHHYALAGAAIFFMLYTLLSVTFPWTRGNIDNTFQNFLWLPGFITYTLPLELLAILVASVILCANKLKERPLWLILVGVLAIFIGTFSEITPVLYLEVLGIILLYVVVIKRFRLSQIKTLARTSLPFIVIGVGLVTGLLLNYLSPATAERRAIFKQATTQEILTQSVKYTDNYLSTYLFGTSPSGYAAILLTIVAGVGIGLILFNKLRLERSWKLPLRLGLLCTLFAFIAISAVFICFAVVFKGYGITPYSYLLPRFEIMYNVWFCLFFVTCGILMASILHMLPQHKYLTHLLPISGLLVAIFIAVSTPFVLGETSRRLQVIADFSADWQDQNTFLEQADEQNIDTVTVPVIDIGDAYNIRCNTPSDNWLGAAKQQYYDIPKICSTPQ